MYGYFFQFYSTVFVVIKNTNAMLLSQNKSINQHENNDYIEVWYEIERLNLCEFAICTEIEMKCNLVVFPFRRTLQMICFV